MKLYFKSTFRYTFRTQLTCHSHVIIVIFATRLAYSNTSTRKLINSYLANVSKISTGFK